MRRSLRTEQELITDSVRCDAKLNASVDLANGKVTAKVRVRVCSIGDPIEVEILNSSLTASVTA